MWARTNLFLLIVTSAEETSNRRNLKILVLHDLEIQQQRYSSITFGRVRKHTRAPINLPHKSCFVCKENDSRRMDGTRQTAGKRLLPGCLLDGSMCGPSASGCAEGANYWTAKDFLAPIQSSRVSLVEFRVCYELQGQ
jgi:hypothetical protein